MLHFFAKTKDKTDRKSNLSYKDKLIIKLGREQLKQMMNKGLDIKVALL